MSEYEICLEFIRDFYWITIYKVDGETQIVFYDSLEIPKTNKMYYMGSILGCSTYFVWDKAEKFTNINIFKKENSSLLTDLMKKVKGVQTISFLKYMIDDFEKRKERLSFKINEVKEEFPHLFSEVGENSV